MHRKAVQNAHCPSFELMSIIRPADDVNTFFPIFIDDILTVQAAVFLRPAVKPLLSRKCQNQRQHPLLQVPQYNTTPKTARLMHSSALVSQIAGATLGCEVATQQVATDVNLSPPGFHNFNFHLV
jgi:hypothetical protein